MGCKVCFCCLKGDRTSRCDSCERDNLARRDSDYKAAAWGRENSEQGQRERAADRGRTGFEDSTPGESTPLKKGFHPGDSTPLEKTRRLR
ncbi:hypothetical protein Taro_009870 [Colocasia esculenta]|uniref:Uncharacterized protein n=1 Tax=Colocasia esculenta TaxID=4460 RepID=A0A843U1E8_COLES|nr:hypothetical protein [Colocasia esculenta]